LIVDARTIKFRQESFSKESLEQRIAAVTPDVPIVESEMLTDYDSYYYSRDREAPLPVLRIKFGDPDQTWLYIDPRMSQIVTGMARINRIAVDLHRLPRPRLLVLVLYRPCGTSVSSSSASAALRQALSASASDSSGCFAECEEYWGSP
jgi:hypothetical protein